jgi:hypothetical protein
MESRNAELGRKVIPYLRVLTPTELGYIAAMFDGEGTIGVYRSTSSTRQSYVPVAQVYNTNLTLLDYLKGITQIGQVKPLNAGTAKHKASCHWVLNHRDMKYLLPLVHPHLIIKQRQAEIVLDYLENCSGIQKVQATGAMLYHRESLYEETLQLNKRGV